MFSISLGESFWLFLSGYNLVIFVKFWRNSFFLWTFFIIQKTSLLNYFWGFAILDNFFCSNMWMYYDFLYLNLRAQAGHEDHLNFVWLFFSPGLFRSLLECFKKRLLFYFDIFSWRPRSAWLAALLISGIDFVWDDLLITSSVKLKQESKWFYQNFLEVLTRAYTFNENTQS